LTNSRHQTRTTLRCIERWRACSGVSADALRRRRANAGISADILSRGRNATTAELIGS
jgi:hypothetical protein